MASSGIRFGPSIRIRSCVGQTVAIALQYCHRETAEKHIQRPEPSANAKHYVALRNADVCTPLSPSSVQHRELG
jgi:hypothetical protein